jgi:cysteinyl-tRNA synthetase
MRIYNTLSRDKEELAPARPGEIRMYVCGVTVYDLSHVGHARSAIVFDVIRRYLAFKGFRVTFVKNFTDVDDRIIRRAQEEGRSAAEVAERYIAAYREDMGAIGVLPGDVEPKATDHVPEMIELIERLLAGGYAYVVEGDVYFAIRRFLPYGRLSGKDLESLLAGARVEVDERKQDPRDFALWKAAKPGEPAWPSPWGPGRPGWHIECSAMAMRYLGTSFDIHGGGEDLIFPHHECEIAQSEAATGKPFARYWIHNAFVNLGAEKMSKSLGNTLAIREVVKRHPADALRLWLLGAHYRSPIEFSEDRLREAGRALERFSTLIDDAVRIGGDDIWALALPERGGDPPPWRRPLPALQGREPWRTHVAVAGQKFEEAMDDDFNMPVALAAMFDLARTLLQRRDGLAGLEERQAFVACVHVLVALGRALGLFEVGAREARPPAEVGRLLAERAAARGRRDWKRSDELREAIHRLGWQVEDTPAGPRLTRRAP